MSFGPEGDAAIKREAALVLDRLEMGQKPCTKTPDGQHDWKMRQSLIVHWAWYDQCQACKATR